MPIESFSLAEELPDELPLDYTFPEEYDGAGEQMPFEQEKKLRAGKALFFDVDDIPVVQLFNNDGSISVKYGLKDGKLVADYPGEDKFYNEGSIISKERFIAELKAMGSSE